jgi:hypothetical protein
MSVILGWTINKEKIAYYAFGNKSRSTEVEDFVVEDAINLLKSELNTFKANLYDSVQKTDTLLIQAIELFSACLIIKSGNGSYSTGQIQSESIDGMSVSYGSKTQTQQLKTPIPDNYCEMAQNMIKQWLIANKKLNTGKYNLHVVNYRDLLFNGSYDKYRHTNSWVD